MSNFYEVIVGNIGKVHEGTDRIEAEKDFTLYKSFSKENFGRAAGESVDLYLNGEPIAEFAGSLQEAEMKMPWLAAKLEMVAADRILARKQWEYAKSVGYDKVRETLFIEYADGERKLFIPSDEEREADDWVFADLKLP